MTAWEVIQLVLIVLALAMIIVAIILDCRARRLQDHLARHSAHLRSAAFALGGLVLMVISMFIAAVFA